MTANGLFQLVLYLVVLLAVVKPLGAFMARVYEGQPAALDRASAGSSGSSTALAASGPSEEMSWKAYALAMLAFNGLSLLAVYLLQRLQGVLPLNPQGLAAVSPDSSFNTAVSFVTNTNWQGYGGETTMSYLTQMLALTVQNFVSAATGHGGAGRPDPRLRAAPAETIGNFWVDLTRTTLYILLPLSVSWRWPWCRRAWSRPSARIRRRRWSSRRYDEPVPTRTASPCSTRRASPRPRRRKLTEQVIAVGPAASQIAIKQLGTNGGGFFNVNSAHPFENPTPLSNFLEMLAILLIPAALCYTFGVMVGTRGRAGRCWPP